MDKNTKDQKKRQIVRTDDPILITGSAGFIGTRVVEALLRDGFKNLRCFVRPSSKMARLDEVLARHKGAKVRIVKGNLVSREDCDKAADGASVIYHLATGVGKSFPDCFLNSVVTTRNLLEATLKGKALKRFVNVSSFAVYSTMNMRRGDLLDETCEIEDPPQRRGEAYCYGKVKQEELLLEYAEKHGTPYVILRPGYVYGPGKNAITGRVGIGTFGVYLHLGGSIQLPMSYVDNCADAIALAGIREGVDGEVFNVVDDDLRTSREFLKLYKKNVRNFRSISLPYPVTYLLCSLWERYSGWSEGQLPPAFNRSRCSAEWKGNRYSNEKLKRLLEWRQRVPTDDGLKHYFDYCKGNGGGR